MDPVTASLAAGAVGGGINAAATYFSGKATNEANIQMNRENNAQNQYMTLLGWERENTAVQRRVGDLREAGLSPTLAAGQGAAAGAPIKMDAGHEDNYAGPAIGAGIQTALAATQLAKTKADISNVVANTSKTETDELAVNQNMEQELIMNNFKSKAISAQTFQSQMEALRKKYELERDRKFGLGEKSTPLSRQGQDIVSAGETAAKNMPPLAGTKADGETRVRVGGYSPIGMPYFIK